MDQEVPMSKVPDGFSPSLMRLVLLSAFFAFMSWGQGSPPMRSRYLGSLTNTEIEDYLKRNDIIFVPVGNVEVHGGFPTDCEYVGPLAFAQKMAEEVDGLVFPYLAYFFPGGTVVGRGTVYVTPSEGLAYLKAIARSLLRQGFRRQIYLTGHGPSPQTLSPLIREFFDETRDPILYIETGGLMRRVKGDFNKVLFGAYSIVGRLEDIPLNVTQVMPDHPRDPSMTKLQELGPPSGAIGAYFGDPGEHGGRAKPITAEQRAAWAKEGAGMIEAAVKAADMKGIVQAMRDHDKYTQEVILPKYGNILPK
jgi:creatinine amidohydrolase